MTGEQLTDEQRTLFDYAAKVEEALRRSKRDELLLLAPREWALMERWLKGGIPVEAAVRAISEACEKACKKALARVTLADCDKALRGDEP